MAREAGFGRRGSLVLLLLCVIVFAQVAALSSQFEQHGACHHCCLLCHVGPLALLTPSVPVALAPVAPAGWRAASPVSRLAREMPLTASSSRLVPYRELPVRRRNPVSGHVFYGTKRKRRSASAMAVHCLRSYRILGT